MTYTSPLSVADEAVNVCLVVHVVPSGEDSRVIEDAFLAILNFIPAVAEKPSKTGDPPFTA